MLQFHTVYSFFGVRASEKKYTKNGASLIPGPIKSEFRVRLICKEGGEREGEKCVISLDAYRDASSITFSVCRRPLFSESSLDNDFHRVQAPAYLGILGIPQP